MTKIKAYFYQNRGTFLNFQKREGETSLHPSSYSLLRVTVGDFCHHLDLFLQNWALWASISYSFFWIQWYIFNECFFPLSNTSSTLSPGIVVWGLKQVLKFVLSFKWALENVCIDVFCVYVSVDVHTGNDLPLPPTLPFKYPYLSAVVAYFFNLPTPPSVDVING